MRGPDEWLRYYLRQAESFSAPAIDLVAMVGRVYAESCPHCTSTSRVTKRKGMKKPTEICARCAEVWPYEDRQIPKGYIGSRHKSAGGIGRRRRRTRVVPSPRPGSSEERYATWVTVGVIIDKMLKSRRWRWAARCYVLWGLADDSLVNMSSMAAQNWRRAPFAWNRWKFKELLHEGRDEFARRLQRAKLMQGGNWWRNAS